MSNFAAEIFNRYCMEEVRNSFGNVLPALESWLRGVVRSEVNKALADDHLKAKPEKNLSRDEVCELLHISKPTLWKKTKEGEIRATTIGRRVFYKESEVKRFMGE